MRMLLVGMMVVLGGASCSDVCSDAEEVIKSCADTQGTTATTTEDIQCEGGAQKAAQCLVDHTEYYCDYQNDVAAESNADNLYYVNCIQGNEGGTAEDRWWEQTE